MSVARDLFLSARAAGIAFESNNGKLRMRSASPPPPPLIDALRAHKAELIAFLAAQDARAAIDERAAILGRWRAEIDAAPAFENPWRTLKAVSLRFLASPRAREAVALGWDELALFGVFSGDAAALSIRVDAQGLVSGMALSVFDYRIMALAADCAILATGSGARHTHRRGVTCAAAIPWRLHPDLTGAPAP